MGAPECDSDVTGLYGLTQRPAIHSDGPAIVAQLLPRTADHRQATLCVRENQVHGVFQLILGLAMAVASARHLGRLHPGARRRCLS